MAPVTAGSVSVKVVPEHNVVGPVMAVPADGAVIGVTFSVSAGPVPHELVPEAMIIPAPAPTDVVIVPVVLEPVQPAPENDQLNEVAAVSVAVNTADAAPAHGPVVAAITGAGGTVMAVTVKVNAAPAPQLLSAAAVTVAVPVPAVKVIDVVVLVPLHPVPDTVQV